MTDVTTANGSTVAEKIAALPKTRIDPERVEQLPSAFRDRILAGELFPVEVQNGPHSLEDLLILPYEDRNDSMWINSWQGERVYSWWVRKTNHEIVTDEPTAQVEAERDMALTQVEGLKAEAERLRARITDLEEARRIARSHHEADIERIGSRLIDEAVSRDWCGEYDAIVRSLNEDLVVPLKQRERDYDVELRVSYRIVQTVRATSSEEAQEKIESGDEQVDLDGMIDVSDPYETEVTDVERRY